MLFFQLFIVLNLWITKSCPDSKIIYYLSNLTEKMQNQQENDNLIVYKNCQFFRQKKMKI